MRRIMKTELISSRYEGDFQRNLQYAIDQMQAAGLRIDPINVSSSEYEIGRTSYSTFTALVVGREDHDN